MKKIIILLMLFVSLYANNFDNYFDKAQNYYWLTIDEGIKSGVYFKTKKYIKLAYEDLKKNPNLKNKNKLDALNLDLQTFYNVNYYSMDGYFPMLRFISTSFFFFPKKSRQHTLAKPAVSIAVSDATEALTNNMKILVQNQVLFNSKNPLWNQIAFEKFNAHGKYFARLPEEPKNILSKSELEQFYNNELTPKIITKLLNYLKKTRVYIIRVEETPLEKNDFYVTAYGETYEKGAVHNIEKSSITFGYAIDERGKWLILIFVHLVLLLIVFLVTFFLIKKKNISLFVVVFIGFLIGRILPWVLIPSLESFMPSTDLNVLNTLWWVVITGVAIILAPIYGMNIIYVKLPAIVGRGGIVGLSISAGVLGYLFVPYIFTYGDVLNNIMTILYFTLFSTAMLLSGYTSGKIFDKTDKTDEYLIFIFVITSAGLFISLIHVDLIWLTIVSIFTIVISIIILKLRKVEGKNVNKKVKIKDNNIEIGISGQNYYKFKYYDEIVNNIGSEI